MATDSSLEVDTQTCHIADISSDHSTHIEDDTEARKLGTRANTLVTLTYTVESQMDEGVAGLGTCQQDAVTTVIVDPDDIVAFAKGEVLPTSTSERGGRAEDLGADSPHYICQSCSKLTPLDSCYCTHCGHKRGRGRPRGVTGPKGQVTGKAPCMKQEGVGETALSKRPSPSSSSSFSTSSLSVSLHGHHTSTPLLQQANHRTAARLHQGKPNLSKKSLLHSKLQGNGSCAVRGQGKDPGQLPPSGDPSTNGTSPVEYLCPTTTPIVTVPVYPDGGESPDYHDNTDGSPSSCHVTSLQHDEQRLSMAGGDGEEESVVDRVTRTARGCNQSVESDQFPKISTQDQHSLQAMYSSPLHSLHNPSVNFCQGTSVHTVEGTPVHLSQWPQGSPNGPFSSHSLVQPSESSPSRQSNHVPPPQTTPLLHSDNSDLFMFHVDMSVPGPRTTPVVMTVGKPKDSQIVGGDQPKYVLFRSRQHGEEASSGPAPHHSIVLAPVFHPPSDHPPLDHYALVSQPNGSSSVYPQAPMAGYQLLHPQNFVQQAPTGVMRCPTVGNACGVPYTPLQAVWTQSAPPGKFERSGQGAFHQGTYQIVESLPPPPPSAPTRVLSPPPGMGGKNQAPPTNNGSNGWGQATLIVPSSHASWPHPYSIQSSPSVSVEQLGTATSMRALPPSALSSGGRTGHPSNSVAQSSTVAYVNALSECVLSPASHRPAHLHMENGVDEHSIVVYDVGADNGKEGSQQQCRPQKESVTSNEDRPMKIRRVDSEDGGGGAGASKGCGWCYKVLENGVYQCANCKENYRLATSPRQPSSGTDPVLLSAFVGHLQGLGMLEQVVSAIATEQLQARLGLKKAEEEYRELEMEHDDMVHRKTLKTKELYHLTSELQELVGSNGLSPVAHAD